MVFRDLSHSFPNCIGQIPIRKIGMAVLPKLLKTFRYFVETDFFPLVQIPPRSEKRDRFTISLPSARGFVQRSLKGDPVSMPILEESMLVVEITGSFPAFSHR